MEVEEDVLGVEWFFEVKYVCEEFSGFGELFVEGEWSGVGGIEICEVEVIDGYGY